MVSSKVLVGPSSKGRPVSSRLASVLRRSRLCSSVRDNNHLGIASVIRKELKLILVAAFLQLFRSSMSVPVTYQRTKMTPVSHGRDYDEPRTAILAILLRPAYSIRSGRPTKARHSVSRRSRSTSSDERSAQKVRGSSSIVSPA